MHPLAAPYRTILQDRTTPHQQEALPEDRQPHPLDAAEEERRGRGEREDVLPHGITFLSLFLLAKKSQLQCSFVLNFVFFAFFVFEFCF
jgi:hypothetical protein